MASTAELLIRVQADAGQATAALRTASDGVKQLGGATATAAEATTKGNGIFARFGQELGSIGKIAAGMATGMLAANLTMGIAERFADAATQIDKFGNAVRKVQVITGDSAENSSALVAVFQRFGFTGDEAASKLSRFERALVGQESALDLTQAGGKKGADILRSIGVATEDATGKTLPMIDVLKNLAGRWNTLDADTKNATARGLFGGLGGGGSEQMNLMLSQGREGLEAITEAATKYGLVLTQGNIEDVKRFTFAHRDMDMALQGVALQIGASFMPAVTALAQVMVGVAQAMNQAVMPALRALPALLPVISALIGVALVGAIANATIAMGRFAVAGIVSTISGLGKLAVPMGALIARYAAVAVAATASAASMVAAWLVAAGPLTLVIGGIVLAAGAIALALSGKLGEAKDAIGAGIAKIAEAVKNGWDMIAKLSDPTAFAAGQETGAQFGEGTEQAIESSGVKAAKAAKEVADAASEALKSGATSRKLDFDLAHVDAERAVLDTKFAQTKADAELVGYKRQLEDLDRNSVDYAQKRLQLDQQDTVTRASAAVEGLQFAATQRKMSFDIAHVSAETNVLSLKLQQTSAEEELIGYKRQLEDLDRNSVDYAQKRADLDEQDAVTRAKIAESALKANDEDLSFQEKLLKAQLLASRHGGPAVDRKDVRAQLKSLNNQQILSAPALLMAEHNTALANRAQEANSLPGNLAKTELDRQKLGIQEAMAPSEAEALNRQRAAEDAQRLLDVDRQRFELNEQTYRIQLLQAEGAKQSAEHAKSLTDAVVSLASTALERAKLVIQEAMAPFEAAANFAKQATEDAQRAIDLEKQWFAIKESYYEKDRLRAEIAAKDAEHNVYSAEHAPAAPVTVNVQPGAIVVQNGGDPQAVAGAVLKGVTQAIDASRSGPMVVAPQVGGGRYATG